MSRSVVPQSTGPQLSPPRRPLRTPTRQRALDQQVSLISPSTSPMAVGLGRMVSHSTTQSNFCPCEVGILSTCSHGILMHSQRALNALHPSTAGLSPTKKSSISVESKRSACRHSTDAEMQLRWKLSKQNEWYGFYSEVSPLRSKPNPRADRLFW